MSAASTSFLPVAERVVPDTLKAYAGRKVCMAGKIVEQQHGVLVLEGTGSKRVTVTGVFSPITDNEYVEVFGIAQADGSITYADHGVLGNSFDVSLYEEMVNASNMQGFYRKFMIGKM